jgi:ubiquinone/menaquinone biosynthesis C-methylase UbiE
MSEKDSDHRKENFYILDNQRIQLHDFPAKGWILDLGGGGEGIIGQLKGNQVIAIDPNQTELEEAAEGPLKIVMDARDLYFIDEVFEVVTSFYTLMYIKSSEHKLVFEEAFRVLQTGGRFLIWDLAIPLRTNQKDDLVVVMLKILLPDTEIETGYGTRWPKKALDISHYLKIADEAGFKSVKQQVNGHSIYCEFRKPKQSY